MFPESSLKLAGSTDRLSWFRSPHAPLERHSINLRDSEAVCHAFVSNDLIAVSFFSNKGLKALDIPSLDYLPSETKAITGSGERSQFLAPLVCIPHPCSEGTKSAPASIGYGCVQFQGFALFLAQDAHRIINLILPDPFLLQRAAYHPLRFPRTMHRKGPRTGVFSIIDKSQPNAFIGCCLNPRDLLRRWPGMVLIARPHLALQHTLEILRARGITAQIPGRCIFQIAFGHRARFMLPVTALYGLALCFASLFHFPTIHSDPARCHHGGCHHCDCMVLCASI